MSLYAELRRRNVFRMAGLYLVGAWLIVQVAETLLPAFGVPAWVLRAVIILLALGFVPALVFSWIYELTPQGLQRDSASAVEPGAVAQTARKLDVAVLVLATLAIGLFAYDRLSERGSESLSGREVGAPTSASGPESDSDPLSRSLAVLPFANMSPDADNEYFADGISEELLNVLSRLGSLKVASRTSAFAFKGKDKSVREIARELGVAHVVEGSVRKQGQRVRITAQLIDARTDQHLWSDTYDRELTDIFAVQEEIAQAISGALGTALGLESGLGKVQVPQATADLAAYETYLRGRQLLHQRGDSLLTARALLEDAVARDPKFAQAWAVLSAVYIVSPGYVEMDAREGATLAVAAAQRARALDDTLALPYAVLGRAAISERRLLEADGWLEQSLQRDARETSALVWRGALLVTVGDFAQAEPLLDRVASIDPYTGINHGWFGLLYGARGDRARGDALLRRASELGWTAAPLLQAMFALGDGERELAARYAQDYYSRRRDPPSGVRRYAQAALAAIRDPSRGAEFVAAVRANRDAGGIGSVSMVAALGLHQEAIELALDSEVPYDAALDITRWVPSARGTFSEPAFLPLAEAHGLMAWWKARGFPEGCRLVDASPAPHLDCTARWR